LPGDARTLRGRFSTLIAPKSDTLAGSLLDDTREELWLLCHDGKLARASLSREGPFEVVTTIPEGAGLSWASGTTFAVHTKSGTLHVLRTDGEVVSRIEGFLPSLSAPYALSESVVICSERGGRLRVSAIPGDSYFTLDDPRATVEAGSIAIASPFVAARHGNRVLCWDLRTRACVGAWTAATTLTSIDVRADGAVLVGEADGTVTLVRPP
jgi:hypothetical protein